MVIDDVIAKTRQFLFQRQDSYRSTFTAPSAYFVMRDLAKFCRAHDSTFHLEPNVAARLDGRREVWLRIAQHLNLTPEQLWELYGGSRPSPGDKP
jgi:hypothetical protein